MKTPVLVFLLAATAGCASHAPAPMPVAIEGTLAPERGIVVGGRLDDARVETVRAAGIRQVIDLTPDAETPDFDEAAVVEDAGLAYANLPLAGAADLTRANVLAFDRLVRGAERPVLVHCASGNRVGAMAALRAAWIDGASLEDAIAIGKAWGLKGLEGEVRRRIEASASGSTQ